MITDLKLVVCSYLNLEEVLILCRNEKILRDQILNRSFKILPNIADACEAGNIETVKYLYVSGVNLTSNLMDIAFEKQYTNIIDFLLQQKLKFDNMLIYEACKNGYLDIVKLFYHYKFMSHKLNWYIGIAIMHNKIEVVKFLLTDTPQEIVDCAVGYNRVEILSYLYEIKKIGEFIYPSIDSLAEACKNGHLEIIKYLHSRGVHFYTKHANIAYYNGHFDIIQFFSEKHLIPDLQNT